MAFRSVPCFSNARLQVHELKKENELQPQYMTTLAIHKQQSNGSADPYNVYLFDHVSHLFFMSTHKRNQKSNTSNEACKMEWYDSKPVVLRQSSMCSRHISCMHAMYTYLGQLVLTLLHAIHFRPIQFMKEIIGANQAGNVREICTAVSP